MRQENTATDAMRTNPWYLGNCQHCQSDFKKVTSWQKYCCEDCRKAAYEARTGKKWHKAGKTA